jgi:hypothetical protein
MRRALIIAIALALVVPSPLGGTARAENARASPSYPAPPVATTSVTISKETIDTAYRTQNPLHSFLEKNQGRYTLFPRATIIPPRRMECRVARCRFCRAGKILRLLEQGFGRKVLGGGLCDTEGCRDRRQHEQRSILPTLRSDGEQRGGAVFFLSAITGAISSPHTIMTRGGVAPCGP